MKLSDLKAADYNPRTITADALSGLKHSIGKFGDLSGIVFNSRSGKLVAGHQRIKALMEQYGDLEIQGDAVVTPDGQRFAVRVVDFDSVTEKAANLTANNLAISGEFTPDVGSLLDDLREPLGDAYDDLRLDEIRDLSFEIPLANKPIDENGMAITENECPKCGFRW